MGTKLTALAGMLVVAVVLGATVLREPIAHAASPFTSVIVGNDTSNPVPVKQQGTVNVQEQNTDASGNIKVHDSDVTDLVATAQLSSANGDDLTVDVSKYREIRFAATSQSCSGSGTAFFIVNATEGGRPYEIMSEPLCNSSGIVDTFFDDLAKAVIEVPGRTIHVFVGGSPGSASIVIFGREN